MITFCVDPLNMPYSQQFAQPPGFDMEIGGLIAEFLQRESGIFWADTGTRGGLGRAMRNSINAGQCNAFMGIVSDPRQDAELEEKGLVLSAPYMADTTYWLAAAYMYPPDDPGFQAVRRRARAMGCPLLEVPDRGPLDWRVLRHLARLCKHYRVDIWHAHDHKSNLFGLILRRIRPMKLVCTLHG